ncbi:protein kinase C theta type-like [Ranitomeya variabilis]|uniref:protein kinase C theta type-like n=1 Tax=Ranitomeya variabilis TaxID=490064 RepID=UPI00405699FC
MGRKRKCGEKNKKSAKKRCTEESFSQRGETFQDIVQDVPVEKTDDPCTTSSGYLPEMKTLKKGIKRGNTSPEKGDANPNKRGRMVESVSGKDVTSEIRFSGSAKTRSSHLHHESAENQSCREQLKRKRTSDTETTTKRRRQTDKSIDQAPEGVIGAQTTSPSEQVAACLSLESFIFTRKLGEGSFGRVMLATHQPSGLQLAVKMVKKRELLENAKHTIRLEREVLEITEGSRFFTHAYGTFQTADYAFYAMEYLSGGTLTAFIKFRAPLNVCTTRFLAAEILSGIQFLHSRGIIHRDLKPDNILLDGDGHAKIADFGLAAMNVFGSQKISEFYGTPGYMAPEMVRRQPFNYSVDLFAFGIIIYQMATGFFPFNYGYCTRRLARSVTCDEPCYPNTMDSQLRNIIARLLCKSPEKRQDFCSNLKGHPFFSPINWEELETERSRPPFTMKPIRVLKTSKQIELHQVMSGIEAQKPPITLEEQRLFCGFSYISNRWKNITGTEAQKPPITLEDQRLICGFSSISNSWKNITGTEAQKPPITPEDQRLICGFSSISNSWKNITGTEAQKPPITPEDQQLICGFSAISNSWKNITGTEAQEPPITPKDQRLICGFSAISNSCKNITGIEAQKPPRTPEDKWLFRGFSYIRNMWKNIKSHINNSNCNIA